VRVEVSTEKWGPMLTISFGSTFQLCYISSQPTGSESGSATPNFQF
jgi:hypothetical protein